MGQWMRYGRKDSICRCLSVAAGNSCREGYRALFEEAERRGLELIGYAYEEGINEISLHSPEEYLTLIQIQCREK